MVQLDPEEIFGSAIWEILQRVLPILACLYIGSLLALIGSLGSETVISLLTSGFTALPRYHSDAVLVLLPFLSFNSVFIFLTVPNILLAALYYFRIEEPTRNRFIIFTTIQQISIAGALAINSLSFDSFLAIALAVIFQLVAWGLFVYLLSFVQNKRRVSHEEHLMAVATENDLWRQKLEDAEIIPPPPSGPEAPTARPLR